MDKVQKIREGVEKLKSQLLRGACSSQIAMETMCKEEAYNEVLAILDTMQEEPKRCMYSKDNYTEEDRKVLCEGCEEKCEFNQVKESAILQHKEKSCKENGNSLTNEPVSVWHDMSEEAENGRNIIIIDPKDFYGVVLRKGGSQLKNHNKERYVRWAYIDDIINITNKEEPVSEPNKELAKTYLAIFDKKFPILPSLSGKQLADYKNFLNKCQQIFGLKEWGIRPIQSKLFEKLTLLWATWGAEHLQGIGSQDEKEQDIPVSEDLEEAANNALNNVLNAHEIVNVRSCLEMFKSGANWQKKRDYIPLSDDINEVAKQICNKVLNCEIDYKEDDVVLSDEEECVKAGIRWQMQKESIPSKDLEELINSLSKRYPEVSFAKLSRIAVRVVKWQKENLWKPADGDDLPEIDREVIALLDNGKVGFAHRPPEYWDGKDIVTGKVTRYYPKTYDKGGWNMPNVKYWLDCLMPKEIEL